MDLAFGLLLAMPPLQRRTGHTREGELLLWLAEITVAWSPWSAQDGQQWNSIPLVSSRHVLCGLAMWRYSECQQYRLLPLGDTKQQLHISCFQTSYCRLACRLVMRAFFAVKDQWAKKIKAIPQSKRAQPTNACIEACKSVSKSFWVHVWLIAAHMHPPT